jgi:hypothetical protein
MYVDPGAGNIIIQTIVAPPPPPLLVAYSDILKSFLGQDQEYLEQEK